MLGKMALAGFGSDPAGLFRNAAEHGDAEGWYQLSLLYREGKTVTKDETEADRLLKIAASRGHPAAKKDVDRISG
jgi:TPR repeat protein